MNNIPSKFRSDSVIALAARFNLTDLYRFLYPNKKEYTYVPNAIANNNRIDHFLISKALIDGLKKTVIVTGRRTKLFDHRTIGLCFGRGSSIPDKYKISDGVVGNSIVELVVEIAIKEAYLAHSDHNATPPYLIRNLNMEIGRILGKLKLADTIELESLVQGEINEELHAQINNLWLEAKEISETLPDQEFFEGLSLGCTPDFFLRA
jgi:hypothetical protein